MKLLSISTASEILSITLVENENIIATFNSEGYKRHAELIAPEIKKIMNDSKLKFTELDGIAINLGPGSFTGLRVGLSTAKGIVYGSNINLYGYTNFEELLFGSMKEYQINGRVAVLIHSRRNEFYFAGYDVLENRFTQLDVFELMSTEDFAGHSHNFDFVIMEKKYVDVIKDKVKNINIIRMQNNSYYGALVVKLNPQKYLCGDYFYLEPLYLKNFEVKTKK